MDEVTSYFFQDILNKLLLKNKLHTTRSKVPLLPDLILSGASSMVFTWSIGQDMLQHVSVPSAAMTKDHP
jgi:hypothetical protein